MRRRTGDDQRRARDERPLGASRFWGRRTGQTPAMLLAPPLPLVLVLVLAACGQSDPEPEPTPVPPTATVAAEGIGPGVGSPAASPAASGEPTLGDLVGRVDAAWAGVGSFRAVFAQPSAGGATPVAPAATPLAGAATPTALSGATESVREVVLPDRQRQIVRQRGEVTTEAVAIGERVWVRGDLARQPRPDAAADAWVAIDPAAVDPNSDAGRLAAALTAPVVSPLAGIRQGLLPQEVRPLGPVTVGDRTCEAYGAADTTEIGGRIDYTIALDADDLPCFVETRTGSVVGRTTYEAYGEALSIEPPASALPMASPPANATPATPIGRD